MQNTNLFWTLLGVLGGGIVSLIISLLFHKLSKRKLLCYTISNISYTSNDDSEACFTVKGTPIKSMYISLVRIYNKSNGLLRPNDFIPDQPLSIVDLDAPGEIYALKAGRMANNRTFYSRKKYEDYAPLRLKHISKEKAIVEFDYIERKRPLEFLVFHSARLHVEGKLVDGVVRERYLLWKTVKPYLLLLLQIGVIGIFSSLIFNFLRTTPK